MQNQLQQEYRHKKQENRIKMFKLVEEWKQSGESQTYFCQSKNLYSHIFHYWLRRYKDQQGPTSSGFIPVTIPISDKANYGGIEIHYPNGVRILLPKNSDLSMVRTFIKLV